MKLSLSPENSPAAIFDRNTWTPLLELSAREVFEIMLCTNLRAIKAPADTHTGEFTALVGLAGSICGVLSIRCTDQAARLMASRMLGVAMEEVDNDSWDALGEIANMIAGNFKAKLSGVGNHCMLSVPTIIVGSDYRTRSLTGGHMIEVILDFEGKPLCVTLELHD